MNTNKYLNKQDFEFILPYNQESTLVNGVWVIKPNITQHHQWEKLSRKPLVCHSASVGIVGIAESWRDAFAKATNKDHYYSNFNFTNKIIEEIARVEGHNDIIAYRDILDMFITDLRVDIIHQLNSCENPPDLEEFSNSEYGFDAAFE